MINLSHRDATTLATMTGLPVRSEIPADPSAANFDWIDNGDVYGARDPEGGVWWPRDEFHDQLEGADDPESLARALFATQEEVGDQLGTWCD